MCLQLPRLVLTTVVMKEVMIVLMWMVMRMYDWYNSSHFADDMMLMALAFMMKRWCWRGKAKQRTATTSNYQDYHDEDIPDTSGFVSSERSARTWRFMAVIS